MNEVIVYKGRTNIISVSFGYDISADTFSSEIREQPDSASTLIATWTVTELTDGTDGELVLTLDNTITSAITAKRGYMDIKRTSGSEPLPVFDRPLEVLIRDSVTA